MKKIKLLTGLSTLTVLGLATLPLTSCNNAFDGTVTEQEWKDAIDYLGGYGKESTYWSFGANDYAAFAYDHDPEGQHDYRTFNFTNWIANPEGVTAHMVRKEGQETTDIVILIKN